MFTIIAIDLDTCEVLFRNETDSEIEAVETGVALDRNPYLIPWSHEFPWRYRVEVTCEYDGLIDHWTHPHWNS